MGTPVRPYAGGAHLWQTKLLHRKTAREGPFCVSNNTLPEQGKTWLAQ
jgi:hypothetical protein